MQNAPEQTTVHSKTVEMFSNLLMNMEPEALLKLVQTLSNGEDYSQHDVEHLYESLYETMDEQSPVYQQFLSYKQFLSTHTIDFVAGGNSKNFIISANEDGAVYMLKVENRLNAPKTIDTYLREDALKDVLTPIFVTRDVDITENGATTTRTLLLTQFCDKGSLEDDAGEQMTNDDRQKYALQYYTQMAQILQTMTNAHCFFPDLKNSNWLIDDSGMLRIADTKTFLYITPEGTYHSSIEKNEGYPFHNTEFVSPPEFFLGQPFSADQAHAYILGRNIYQYLTKCHTNYLPDEHGFRDPIFRTAEGQRFKALIEKAIQRNPPHAEGFTSNILTELNQLIAERKIREECTSMLKNISAYNFDEDDDLIMHDFIRTQLKAIDFVDGIDNLEKMKTDLDHLLVSLQDNSATQDLLNVINTSLNNNIDYSPNMHNTIKKLKQDLLNIPLEKRSPDNQEIHDLKHQMEDLQISSNHVISCKKILQQIESYKTSPHDTKMNEFIQEKTRLISETSNPLDLETIQRDLNEALINVQESSDLVNKIKELIESYKTDTTFYKIGKKRKGESIEQALYAVPIEQRGEILTANTSEARTVRTAIAAHRGLTKGTQPQQVSAEELKKWLGPDVTQTYSNYRQHMANHRKPAAEQVSNQQKDITQDNNRGHHGHKL